MGRQKYGRRKFRKKAIGQIKIHIEPFQTWKLLDLDLRKDHASYVVFDVRQPVKPRRKGLFAFDLVGIHLAESVPLYAFQLHRRSDGLRFPLRHGDAGSCLAVYVIALVQEVFLSGDDFRFVGDVLFHDLAGGFLRVLPRRSAEDVIGKIDAVKSFLLRFLYSGINFVLAPAFILCGVLSKPLRSWWSKPI